jgi:SAM-dependent methyltransferase
VDYERLYTYRFRRVDQASREAVWVAIADYVHEALGRPQKVLDPAAGRCEFIDSIPAAERWGVDMSGQADDLRPGTKMIVGDVFDVELPSSHFDAVFVSNFLEHLDSHEQIDEFLIKMRECLVPGGRIAIVGPNTRFCAKDYWNYADHKVALTHRAVEEHLYTAGLEPTTTHPKFLPYSFTGRLPASAGLTRAYLHFRPAWWAFGKQFLVFGARGPEPPPA